MREIKTKTFVYKRAVHVPRAYGTTLSVLVKTALNKLATIGDRRQSLSGDDEASEWLVIGDHSGDADVLFGILMRYSPGTAAATLLDDTTARRVVVETFKPPQEGLQRREFIDGALFFAIAGNHIVLMQSSAVRDRTLEYHLQWLLHHAAVLPGDHTFSLHDQPTRRARAAATASKVRAVALGGDLFEAPVPHRQARQEQVAPIEEAYRAAHGVSARVWDAIRLLMGEGQGGTLNLSELDVSKVSYSLQLRYEGRRSETSGDTLDRIGAALRNADGVDTKVVLDNGDVIEGDQLRVSGKVRLEMRDGVPIPSGVFEKMRAWLTERIGAEGL